MIQELIENNQKSLWYVRGYRNMDLDVVIKMQFKKISHSLLMVTCNEH